MTIGNLALNIPQPNCGEFIDDVNELYTLDNLIRFLTVYSMLDEDGDGKICDLIHKHQYNFTNVEAREFLKRKTSNYDIIEAELYLEDKAGIISMANESFPITKEDFDANYGKYDKVQLRRCESEIGIIQKYLFSRYISLTEINYAALIIGKLTPVEMSQYIAILESIPDELRFVDDLYMAAFFVVQHKHTLGGEDGDDLTLRNYSYYLTHSMPIRKPEKYVITEGNNELCYRQYLVCDDDWY